MSATYLSVSFWMSSSALAARRPAMISFSLSTSLTSAITSRRTLRTATRAFSASCAHHLGDVAAALLGQRRQRHADHGAGGDRLQPEIRLVDRLLDGLHHGFSHGETTSVRASSTLMFATCLSGMSVP